MSSEERSFIEQARRAQIVRCAIEVIAELGYAGASLAQIAKRARISKGVISYHFAGKDDLLGQVVTQVYTEGAEFMGEALATTETALQTLRVYLATNLDYIKNHRRSIAAVTEILRNLRDEHGQPCYTVDGMDEQAAPLIELFQRGRGTGEFRTFDDRVMALTLRSAIDTAGARLIADPNLDMAAYTEALQDLFEHAVIAR